MKNFFLLHICLSFVSFYYAEIKTANISKDLIAFFLPENPIVVEAGAYDGKDSCEMAYLWPQAMIYAFEPVPHVFIRLASNVHHYKNIVCIEKALSDKTGFDYMFISQGGDYSSSLLEPLEHLEHFPHITFQHKTRVATITLDTWADEMNIDHIDFLWFDLQGMEPLVLKASPKIFKTIKVISTEVSYSDLYKNAPLYPEFKAWMEENGFIVIKEIKHHSTFGDVLFVRKELLQNLVK